MNELLSDIKNLDQDLSHSTDYLANEVSILWHNSELLKFKRILEDLGFTELKKRREKLDRNLLSELRDVFIGIGDIKLYRLIKIFNLKV